MDNLKTYHEKKKEKVEERIKLLNEYINHCKDKSKLQSQYTKRLDKEKTELDMITGVLKLLKNN